jgi:hypothetical protein
LNKDLEYTKIIRHPAKPDQYIAINEKPVSNDFGRWVLYKECNEKGEINKQKKKKFVLCIAGAKMNLDGAIDFSSVCGVSYPNERKRMKIHKHRNAVDQRKITESYGRQLKKSRYFPNISHDLFLSFLTFLCKSHLSFSQSVSESFFDLIWTAIGVGRKHRFIPENSLFPKVSRQTLSKMVHIYGKQLREILLNNLKSARVGVVLDAGKIGEQKYVSILLCRPRISSPILYKLYDGETNKKGYALLGAKIIDELKERGITVTSFVTDGLKYQVSALNAVDKFGFKRYLSRNIDSNKHIQVSSSLISFPSQARSFFLSLSKEKNGIEGERSGEKEQYDGIEIKLPNTKRRRLEEGLRYYYYKLCM